MPTYVYKCTVCNKTFEVIKDKPEEEFCEHCNSLKTFRMATAPAVHFKGTGFFSTDYKK